MRVSVWEGFNPIVSEPTIFEGNIEFQEAEVVDRKGDSWLRWETDSWKTYEIREEVQITGIDFAFYNKEKQHRYYISLQVLYDGFKKQLNPCKRQISAALSVNHFEK